MLIPKDRLKRGKLNSAQGRDGQVKFGAESGWSHEVGTMVPPPPRARRNSVVPALFTVAGQDLAAVALDHDPAGLLR